MEVLLVNLLIRPLVISVRINLIMQELTEGPVLLVGSSMGAWFALIAAKLHPEKVIGVVTLAVAVDFTKELIWDKFTNEEKRYY